MKERPGSPDKRERDSESLRRFLHPEPVGLTLPLPTSGRELYQALDGGATPLEGIGAVVRNRYQETAAIVDAKLASSKYPEEYRRGLALVGAFNFVRGMEVITKDGQIDRDVAPKMMLSPSAAVQVMEEAKITRQDKVLDLFCGTGYSTFFWATANPRRLDAVDKYTSEHYRLPQTFQRAKDQIYGTLPKDWKPTIATPTFLEADALKLPAFDSSEGSAKGFAKGYDKIFLHPPYGRESTRLIPEVSEAEAFKLWINSIDTAKKANNGKGEIYSVVPAEWKDAVQDLKFGKSTGETLTDLNTRLGDLRYYQFPENRSKLDTPYNMSGTEEWNPNFIEDMFNNASVKPLRETGMFGLDLHSIK